MQGPKENRQNILCQVSFRQAAFIMWMHKFLLSASDKFQILSASEKLRFIIPACFCCFLRGNKGKKEIVHEEKEDAPYLSPSLSSALTLQRVLGKEEKKKFCRNRGSFLNKCQKDTQSEDWTQHTTLTLRCGLHMPQPFCEQERKKEKQKGFLGHWHLEQNTNLNEVRQRRIVVLKSFIFCSAFNNRTGRKIWKTLTLF